MSIFELNEILKDDLVLNHGAKQAKTIFFKEGVILIPEPFYENSVMWEEGTDTEILRKALITFFRHREKINEEYFLSEPLWEFSLKRPVLYWSAFLTKEPSTGIYND